MGIKDKILSFVDLFYSPFKKLLPIQTFRYAFCGGANMLLDIFLFFISYNFILRKKDLDIGLIILKPYNGALVMAFCVTFPLGFYLSKYVVFQESYLRGRVQLFRYCLVVGVNLLLNYILLNFFVQVLQFFPTISKIFTTIIVVLFTYLAQKYFTFKMTSSK